MKLTNDKVISFINTAGFTLAGFTPVDYLGKEGELLKEWLKLGYHGSMQYMERNSQKRMDVRNILADAKSVISLGLNYYTDDEYKNIAGTGKVSRYAWGKDYHLIIWEKLEQLINTFKEIDASFNAVSYVDTGPVMDKAWAVRAGIGWMGKHSNVINKEIGSWFFIANIITNYEFTPTPMEPDHCGSCTACIDACPTKAIVSDYVVDANKCISYLTIENKKEIPDEFSGKMESWLFGCDICQDICPWNIKFSTVSSETGFLSSNKEMDLQYIEQMNDEDFNKRFSVSPVKRVKLKGLKRNASFLRNTTKTA